MKHFSINCTPFEEHYSRKPDTLWKTLVDKVPKHWLEREKLILSDARIKDWEGGGRQNRRGISEFTDRQKEQRSVGKRLQKGYTFPDQQRSTIQNSETCFDRHRIETKNVFEVFDRKNAEPYYRKTEDKIISASESTVKLSTGKILR